MRYLEKKIDFLVEQAKLYCGTEATDSDLRQMIANDVLGCMGVLFARRDRALLSKMAGLLSIMPLLKKDAVGLFLGKLQQMEDACLSIQVALRAQTPTIDRPDPGSK